MEFIRRNTDYALRALVHLAQKKQEDVVFVRTIAKEENVSEDFLRKIFQTLTEAGIVNSHRGPKGGFSLAKAPGEITVLEVMEALQGPVVINRCFLGKDYCSNFSRCELKDRLIGVQKGMLNFLNSITIAHLLSAEEENIEKTSIVEKK
jgi:Rrf2 family protein